jgi:hypothetical protein
MIIGAHSIVYSMNADADRAFFRDVLKLGSIDMGGGWLIFGLPPAEVALHPSDKNDVHEFYLMCENVEQLVAELEQHGVASTPVADHGWGLVVHVTLPGGGKLGIYEPRHPRPVSGATLGAKKLPSRGTGGGTDRGGQKLGKKKTAVKKPAKSPSRWPRRSRPKRPSPPRRRPRRRLPRRRAVSECWGAHWYERAELRVRRSATRSGALLRGSRASPSLNRHPGRRGSRAPSHSKDPYSHDPYSHDPYCGSWIERTIAAGPDDVLRSNHSAPARRGCSGATRDASLPHFAQRHASRTSPRAPPKIPPSFPPSQEPHERVLICAGCGGARQGL